MKRAVALVERQRLAEIIQPVANVHLDIALQAPGNQRSHVPLRAGDCVERRSSRTVAAWWGTGGDPHLGIANEPFPTDSHSPAES